MLVEGKGGIQAECLLKSDGNYTKLCTLRIRFPRFVAEQFLKHRMFSCNAVSSRAMSVPKMNKWISDYPVTPLFWGAQKKGMQPSEECTNEIITHRLYPGHSNSRECQWALARQEAKAKALEYWNSGYHQQIPNRLTHAFQMAEYIVSATDWNNFFNLRLHDKAAQSEITELARCMKECIQKANCSPTRHGWHLPMVTPREMYEYTVTELKILSTARCAIISYNNHNTGTLLGLDQARKIYNHLLSDTNPHLTPAEHVARLLNSEELNDQGNTILLSSRKRKQMQYYGNFHGWVSHRYDLESEQQGAL